MPKKNKNKNLMYHNNYCVVFYCVLDFQVGLMYHNKIALFFFFFAVFVFRLSMPRRVVMT